MEKSVKYDRWENEGRSEWKEAEWTVISTSNELESVHSAVGFHISTWH